MAKKAFSASLLGLAMCVFGCGPTRSSARIMEASAELAAAQTAQAEQTSKYEYVAASEYLHKAREEQSYANFESSEILAKRARDCARMARAKAEAQTRTEIGARAIRLPKGVDCRPGPRRAFDEPRGSAEPEPSVEPAPPPAKVAPAVTPPSPKEPQDEPPPPPGEDPATEGQP